MADETCPRCGMEMSDATMPTERNGQTFCCGGCADDAGCECRPQ